jgi:hypothetical protein
MSEDRYMNKCGLISGFLFRVTIELSFSGGFF